MTRLTKEQVSEAARSMKPPFSGLSEPHKIVVDDGQLLVGRMLSAYTFPQAPKPVGYWSLRGGEPEFRLYRTERPRWLHRTMMRLAFGVRWHDKPMNSIKILGAA